MLATKFNQKLGYSGMVVANRMVAKPLDKDMLNKVQISYFNLKSSIKRYLMKL
jgi:hypothetical protein